MGVYKRLADVPESHRLEQYADDYTGADTYEQFLTEQVFPQIDSERTKQKYRLAGRRWHNHVHEQGRHHALSRPQDVDAWMESLLNSVTLDTVYNIYWVKLERFYRWLQRHPDHPHVYHPVLMAAANHDHAAIVWKKKLERGREG